MATETNLPKHSPRRARRSATSSLSTPLIVLFAVAIGTSVANLYYVQPLLPLVRSAFHLSSGVAALATTMTQVGYALGLALLLPLGDLLERRVLVVVLAICAAASLGLAAAAPAFGVLLAAMTLIGLTSVVAQLLVPYAATLAEGHERGAVVGKVMSGLLIGILLARTVSGLLAAATSWRLVFGFAAGAMTLLAVALHRRLPRSVPTTNLSYPALLGSLLEIARSEPVVIRRGLYGICSMGAFSVLWTSIAFLLAGAPYRYNSATIGLFGLVGVAGTVMANVAGRLADRQMARQLTLFSAACLTGGFVLLGFARHDLAALLGGIIVVDIGAQGMQITNQSQIFALRPEARTRINSVYMVMFFFGATSGSALSAAVYDLYGWSGVAVAGMLIGAVSLFGALVGLMGQRAQPPATAGTIESV